MLHNTVKIARNTLSKIKNRRENLPAHTGKELSKSTEDTYSKEFARLVKNAIAIEKPLNYDALIKLAKDTSSIRTWHKRRAALLYYFIEILDKNLKDQAALQRTALGSEEWFSAVAKVSNTTSFLVQLDNEPPIALDKRKPKRSKKRDLRGLPDDWVQQIIKRMPTYQPQILTLAVTGCRPCELVKGVTWSILNNQIVAKIQGAKVGKNSGQIERTLSFEIDEQLTESLAKIISDNGGSCEIVLVSAINLTNAIKSAGRRAFPKFKKSITSISLRHQFSANFKASAASSSDSEDTQLLISAALGHASSQTKGYYGQVKQARSGAVPTSVVATRQVKQKNRKSFSNTKTKPISQKL